MADVRAYYKNDVGYFDNPKIAPLVEDHPRAVILHQRAIAYCAQHLTDGRFPMRLVMRLACGSQCDLDLLVQCGLVVVTDDVTAEVHDYLEHNRSAEDVKRAKDAGQKGAAGRWDRDKHADRNADRNAKSMRTPMPREKERETVKRDVTDVTSEGFNEFYLAYPRKGARADAAKAWKAAAKKVELPVVLSALEAHKRIWATKDAQFTPLPASWLRGERWADELEPAPKPRNPNIPEGW